MPECLSQNPEVSGLLPKSNVGCFLLHLSAFSLILSHVGAAFPDLSLPVLSLSKGRRLAAIRHSGRREATIRNPEKAIVYWIPDLDFASSGMTLGAVSRLFQQPAAKVTEYVILRSCRRRRISRSFALLRMTHNGGFFAEPALSLSKGSE